MTQEDELEPAGGGTTEDFFTGADEDASAQEPHTSSFKVFSFVK
ncbi:unnamed protein product, partial [Globisporangium polare]